MQSEAEKRNVAIWCLLIGLGLLVWLFDRQIGQFFIGVAVGFSLRGIAQAHWGSA